MSEFKLEAWEVPPSGGTHPILLDFRASLPWGVAEEETHIVLLQVVGNAALILFRSASQPKVS